jgi:threonine/homoserine/homoserine lactone efflux protein
MLTPILKGISFGLFMALSVGPTIFAVLKYSISYGHRAGISYILGVSVSDLLYLALANLAAGLLQFAEQYQQLIGIAGGLLLIGMGLHGYFKKVKIVRNTNSIVPVGIGGLLQIAVSGFLMNSLNPGVIITWMGMTTIVASESLNYRILLFSCTLITVLSFDFLKVFMANRVRKLLTPRNIVYLQRIAALCLMGVGIFLLIKFIMGSTAQAHI